MSAVLYAEPLPPDLQEIVRAELPVGWTLEVAETKDRAELLRRMSRADFLIVATTRVDAELLAAAPRLRHVQHQGVGYNNIDVPACAARGVTVALTPEGTTTGVAEHVFLLLLALYKRLREAETKLRAGAWPVWELRSRSFEIAGKIVGIVGLGRIGQAVARRLAAFEARVLYYDLIRPPLEVEQALSVAYCPLEELLRVADVVTLHLPLSDTTRHLIGARELALMQSHAVLINTARGALVDELALIEALRNGTIAGAGLDVFEQEPPLPDHPLLRLENVVVTPHIAAGTIDAFRTKMRAVFANLQRVALGEPPINQINQRPASPGTCEPDMPNNTGYTP